MKFRSPINVIIDMINKWLMPPNASVQEILRRTHDIGIGIGLIIGSSIAIGLYLWNVMVGILFMFMCIAILASPIAIYWIEKKWNEFLGRVK